MTEDAFRRIPGMPDLERDYRIVRELGRGGSAVVYLARELEVGREVAIKLIRPEHLEDEDAVVRLVREARTVGELQHPNIVMLLGIRHYGDRGLALILQYVQGQTLRERLREGGPLTIQATERILADLARGLAYAHRRRIVHRDLKPENVYLDEALGLARLADFGIARAWDKDSGLTLPGTAIGTPTYMSPEQVDGRDLDGRSDLYSLGLLGHEMLTGRQPWAGEPLTRVIHLQKSQDLPPVTASRPDVPVRLRQAIEGALRKDPEERWSSAERFLEALLQGRPLPARVRQAESPVVQGPLTAARIGPAPEGGIPMEDQVTIRYPVESADVGSRGDPPRSGWGQVPSPGVPPADGPPRWTGVVMAGVAILAVLMGIEAVARGPDGLIRGLFAHRAPVAVHETGAERGEGPSASDPGPPASDPVPWAPEPGPSLRETAPPASESDLPSPLPTDLEESDDAEEPGELDGLGEPEGPEELEGPAGPDQVEEPDELEEPALPLQDPLAATGDAPTGEDDVDGPVGLAGADGLSVRLAVATGGAHSCALHADGSMTCWGANDQGQLGDGSRASRTAPGGSVGEGPFLDVAAGMAHVCALDGEGRALCWGANEQGQLGGTLRPQRGRPGAVAGNARFQALASGAFHTCGVTAEGTVWCWGENGSGQLGDGSLQTRSAPTRVAANRSFRQVAAGVRHTCALDTGGAAHCWGANHRGELGTGDDSPSPAPRAVAGGHAFRSLAAGASHTCGVRRDGRILCWGSNEYGQLGDGTATHRALPTELDIETGFTHVAVGAVHTCALAESGEAFCWGRNLHGQVGDGTTRDRTGPVPVAGGHRFSTIHAFGSHNCGRTAGGEALCWGYNLEGQVGDGTRENRLVPTRVSGNPP